jgi:hypothetical protein
MLEVRQDGDDYYITVSEAFAAPAQAVYGLLANVRRHLEWGGRRLEGASQRLLAMDAPEGELGPGAEWTSVGMTAGRAWHDRSRVTEARPPQLFEFETEGRLEDAPNVEPIEGRWVHRYEISPDGAGCRITYRMKARLTLYIPPGQHSRYPAVVYRIVLPRVVQQGVQSLGRMAEEEAAVPAAAAAAAEGEPPA